MTCVPAKFGIGKFGVSKFGNTCEVVTGGKLYSVKTGILKRKTDMYSSKTSSFKRKIY